MFSTSISTCVLSLCLGVYYLHHDIAAAEPNLAQATTEVSEPHDAVQDGQVRAHEPPLLRIDIESR